MRWRLRITSGLTLLLALAHPGPVGARGAEPLTLKAGPHLFIDDFLIAKSNGLKRTTHQPTKVPEPVLRRGASWHLQPMWFMMVAHDAHAGRFRAWYNVKNPSGAPNICYAYAESNDGITWQLPELGLIEAAGPTSNIIDAPIGFYGLFMVDEGPKFPDLARRYKMAYYGRGADDKIGLCVAFSADGLRFHIYEHNPVMLHAAEDGSNVISDIIDGCWDPLKSEYLLGCKVERNGYPGKARYHAAGFRRCVGMSTSKDFVTWEKPRLIITPDPRNGIEEFYGCKPMVRGNLYLGFLRVLRDDLPATPGGPVEGIGWTELATSRDGQSWTRHQETFIDRDSRPGAWDHAMAWYADGVTVGDKEYIYYGGYSEGHKVGEREVGLAMLRKNGFVSRDAGAKEASLRTPLVTLAGTQITVNANVENEMRVQVLDENGAPIGGFGQDDCMPIRGDSVAHLVAWNGKLADLQGRRVQLEFIFSETAFYAFDLK